MKNRKLILLFFLICFLSVILSMAGKRMRFSEKQVQKMEKKALSGDIKASYTLTDFFAIDVGDGDKMCLWSSIWFENDSVGGAKNFSSKYCLTSIESLRYPYLLFLSEDYMIKKCDEQFKQIQIETYKRYHKEYPDFRFCDDNLEIKEEINSTNYKYFYKEALWGSGLAALKLAQYYEKINNQNIYKIYPQLLILGTCYNPDEEKYPLFWYRIGSQNGNKECMKKYAELLLNSKDKYDNIRAEFWKKKSEEKE